MSDPDVRDVIDRLGRAMARQRTALESSDYDLLEAILPECEAALASITSFPGGVTEIRHRLQALSPEERSQSLSVLEQANADHRIGRDLIGLAMQRSAAVKNFQAKQIDGATYSQQGDVSHAIGIVLSHKA